MLRPAPDYDSLLSAFRWQIPDAYNIGVDVCDRWAAAAPERPAILDVATDGRVATLTYGALR
jgi:acetyl-CoA synthetase